MSSANADMCLLNNSFQDKCIIDPVHLSIKASYGSVEEIKYLAGQWEERYETVEEVDAPDFLEKLGGSGVHKGDDGRLHEVGQCVQENKEEYQKHLKHIYTEVRGDQSQAFED